MVDSDVVRKQIIHQVELVQKHLNTKDVNKIFEFVKTHIIYPGSILDKPMADINRFGDHFIIDAINKIVKKWFIGVILLKFFLMLF